MRSRKTATRVLVAAASLAAIAAAILAVAASAQPGQRANHPVKPFHLTKNCDHYFGGIGDYCTVSYSNLPALPSDADIFYAQPAGATSLDSDTILYAGPGNTATGHCSLDFGTGLGHCSIFGGTGTLEGLHASVEVSLHQRERLGLGRNVQVQELNSAKETGRALKLPALSPPTWQRVEGALASACRRRAGRNLPLRLAQQPSGRRLPTEPVRRRRPAHACHQSRPLPTLARLGHSSLTLRCSCRMFFRLSTWELWLIIAGIILGFVVLGYLAGRVLRVHVETLREPVGVVQGALLAIVGLVLAFGLSLALGRYDSRRAAVVDDANTIGTTYLRAQTLSEPTRTRSLGLLKRYTDASLQLSHAVPTTPRFRQTIAKEDGLQRQLWGLAGNALKGAPQDSAPRLYVETLNEMIDQQTVRVAALNNRIPNAVLALEVFGTAIAFGLLALYTAMHGRGATTVFLAGLLVTVLLLVIFDLDRPTRGLIRVPDAPLVALARVDGCPSGRAGAVARRARSPSGRRGPGPARVG